MPNPKQPNKSNRVNNSQKKKKLPPKILQTKI